MKNTYEIAIERIVPKGLGIGFADGLTFFVPLAAPGDLLRVEPKQVKGRTVFAEIAEVIEASPQRRTPHCRHFGSCGGCDFQHLDYASQLKAKSAIVTDCLRRIGKFDSIEFEIVPSPQEFGYRSRMQLHADTKSQRIGFFKRSSHEIIEARSCPVLVPDLESAMNRMRDEIAWDGFWAENIEIEAASSAGRVSVFSAELIEPTEELDFCVGPDRYVYDARSFFQGNQLLIPKLIELAVGETAGDTALDLYCGVGLFTLPLARAFQHVTAVESGSLAIESARRNLENAGLGNVELADETVSSWLRANSGSVNHADFIVLDPPRSGTEKGVIDAVIGIGPKAISYVSCEPSILARDLRSLVDGGYSIDRLTAIDLFPQTHHVETVVRLSRSV